MTDLLDRARTVLADLPEADQRELVVQLVEAVAVRRLKAMFAEGRASLVLGDSMPFDIESIIEEANEAHASD